MRVAVVGAGVLGASTALHLAGRGARVTLVEAVAPGSGTSSRGAGLVCEGLWHPTSIALARRSLDLLDDLSERCARDGVPFRLTRVGSTTLVPARLADAARRLAALQRAHGVDVREVEPARVPDLPRHAGLSVAGVETALHYARDAWALPRMYCEIAHTALQMAGGAVQRGAASLRIEGGRASLFVGGARVDADEVVLAAGIHTRALLQAAGLDAPLLAYRTQAARVVHARAGDAPMLHDAALGWYLRPGAPGQLVAGNGTTTRPEDPAAWNATADEAFTRATLARLRERFPHMGDATLGDAWAGLDTATPDRLPLAGRARGAEGLWLCVGGNGHGFMRAPAIGESLAALVAGDKPRIDFSAFAPARFEGAPPFAIREGYSLDESRP